MSLVVEAGAAGGEPVVRVLGELDEQAAPELAEAVRRQVSGSPGSLCVDLTGTTYLNSSGARQLVVLAREAVAAGVALRVECARDNRAVWRVVDILQLGSVVPIVAPGEPT